MRADRTDDLFALVPRWWFEPVVGLAVVAVAVAGLAAGGWVVRNVMLESLFGVVPQANLSTVDGVSAFALATVLLALVYGVIGVGAAYVYLTYWAIDPGFVLDRPDAEGTRLLAGLAVLAPVTVGAGTAVNRLADASGDMLVGGVPESAVFYRGLSAAPAVWPPSLAVEVGLHLVLLAGIVGPAVGVLYHGVVQTSVRRVARPSVAAAVTTVAVVTTKAMGTSGTVDLAATGAFAFGVAVAYDRTDNLAVPAVGYALLNTATLVLAAFVVLTKYGPL